MKDQAMPTVTTYAIKGLDCASCGLKIENAIKKLRQIQPFLSLLTPEKILELFPDLTPPIASKLCRRFNS